MAVYELKLEFREDSRKWVMTQQNNDKMHFAFKEKIQAIVHARKHCRKFRDNHSEPVFLKIYSGDGTLQKHYRYEVGGKEVQLEIVGNKAIWGRWFNA